jgi:MFS family permease
MQNRLYNIINNSLGWLCFIIAAATYLLTIEPTASFWDCPEFISQGFKLEVGHPPGNPIFMLTARFFINFVGGDPGHVAAAVNSMNALLSAGTILLLFWTVTHLTRRLLTAEGETTITTPRAIATFGAGLVGALAYAWSDTFWYSAVEGEVYAFSSFCTALVFWLILKWQNRAEQPHSDRYLVLIAYVIGVSIAVHLLNLLCIPAIVLVFYYTKFSNTNLKGSIIALLLSFVIVALILYGLVPGFIEVAQYFELFFVNQIGCPYNTGVLIYTILTVGVFIWAVRELYLQRSAKAIKWSFLLSIFFSGIPFIGSSVAVTLLILIGLFVWLWSAKKLPVRVLTLVVMSVMVIFAGYSSYALLLIRSSANTPMNQNAPDNVFALSSYLNREQYGKTPLFYGTTFTSDVQRDAQGSAISSQTYTWAKTPKSSPNEKDRYSKVVSELNYKYIPEQNMLFPRMYDSRFASQYKRWAGITDADLSLTPVHPVDGSAATEMRRVPTFGQNLSYFLNYQLNYMYMRYFLWNFAGRQNDLQGLADEPNRGNWISGIPFIDNARLGDQSLLPDEYGKGNKGHNVFYMLPLLLGLLGLLWQSGSSERGIRQFWVVFFLFFMTGLAIVLYLNQVPNQPRERDYAYAGSFYAFAIWIGIGVAALYAGLNKLLKGRRDTVAAVVASVLGLIVPIQMVSQTWDDHDRSGRYTCRDFGMNYLSSLDENAIIFTNGDNDTFPLWYAQEVEGYRTDVRVVNLSYLTTEWYAHQQFLPSYEAKPIAMQATSKDLALERRQQCYLIPDSSLTPVSSFLREYYSDRPDQIGRQVYGMNVPVMQGGDLYIPIDIDAAIKAGRIGEENVDDAVDAIYIDFPSALRTKNHQTVITQADALMLDILNTSVENGWNRPVYIATTVSDDLYLGFQPYLYTTGMAREILPLYCSDRLQAKTDKAYRNITERFRWGGLDKPDAKDVYLDETVVRMVNSTRYAMMEVVRSLIAEGQMHKALNILQLIDSKLPPSVTPYGVQVGDEIAETFVMLGEELNNEAVRQRGLQLYREEVMRYAPHLRYLSSLPRYMYNSLTTLDRAIGYVVDNRGGYSYVYNLLIQYGSAQTDMDSNEAISQLVAEVEKATGVNVLVELQKLGALSDTALQ